MKFSLFLISFFYSIVTMGQNNGHPDSNENNKESYVSITDSFIKNEVEIISIKRAETSGKNRIFSKKILGQIPFRYCSDTLLKFEKSNFFTGEYLSVAIVLSETQSKVKLSNIVIAFYKTRESIPAGALIDIVNTMNCQQIKKKGSPIMPSCEVFQSPDRRRVYVHMINKEEKNKFEVTWIMQDRKYYGRVVDRL